MQFMEYCLVKYHVPIDPRKWIEFCDEYHVERFVERFVSAAFDDPELYAETLRFTQEINDRAVKVA